MTLAKEGVTIMDVRDFVRAHYPGAVVVETLFSYFAEMLVIRTTEGTRLVVKNIVPDALAQANDPVALATSLNERTSAFRQVLAERRVPLAPFYEMHVEGRSCFHVSTYCGDDSWLVASSRPADLAFARDLAQSILLAARGVLEQGQQRPKVGLDGRLSNFAGGYYVDTFPPLVRLNGRYHVHFPEPETPEDLQDEIERKFRWLGILRRLAFDFLAVNPLWEGLLIEEAVKMFGSEVQDFFAELPDIRIVEAPLNESLTLLDRLGPKDKDTLRCLAARLLPVGPRRAENMHVVFSLSRKDPSPGFPGPHETRVAQLKRWLAQLLAMQR